MRVLERLKQAHSYIDIALQFLIILLLENRTTTTNVFYLSNNSIVTICIYVGIVELHNWVIKGAEYFVCR